MGDAAAAESTVQQDQLYFFFLEPGRWESALAAADFDALLLRPSRSTLDALEAAFFEVTLEVLLCDIAEPAADFDALPVELPLRVVEALVAALFPVRLFRAMIPLQFSSNSED
jgi:hypothetical protein